MNPDSYFRRLSTVAGLDPANFRHSPCGRIVHRGHHSVKSEFGWVEDPLLGSGVHWTQADSQ
jgi:hypothetical protein